MRGLQPVEHRDDLRVAQTLSQRAGVAGPLAQRVRDLTTAIAFAKGTLSTLERRLNDSISAVASFIIGAWESAGKPAIPKDGGRTPRPIRRPKP